MTTIVFPRFPVSHDKSQVGTGSREVVQGFGYPDYKRAYDCVQFCQRWCTSGSNHGTTPIVAP